MTYTITGKIFEKETGSPLSGLIVRVSDIDNLYEDQLGMAVTDNDGNFQFEFQESAFKEIFKRKPDIYLTAYSSTFQPVFHTEEIVRWGEREEEHFDISIPREDLHGEVSDLSDDYIDVSLHLTEENLVVKDIDGFKSPELPGYTHGGIPGEPALPMQLQYLALARGADVLELEVDPGVPVRITDIKQPMPVQESVPHNDIDQEEYNGEILFEEYETVFTPLAEEFLLRKGPYPEELVRLEGKAVFNYIHLALVRVTPVQYDSGTESYLFYPDLTYRAKITHSQQEQFTGAPESEYESIGRTEAEVLDLFLLQDNVYRMKDLRLPSDLMNPHEIPHVIITDNFNWPEKRKQGKFLKGTALDGDLITEFNHLAEWKTAKGIRSKVVSVSQIVAGQFGDMTEGGKARDLPEVIRNFVKYANKTWKTAYFLMGGDIDVVPMRRLTGSDPHRSYGVYRGNQNPPNPGRCYLDLGNAILKIRPNFTPRSDSPLATCKSGITIPFDRNASSTRLGWYYTSENDFTYKNLGFTRLADGQSSRYVIVQGPITTIDDDLYWLVHGEGGNAIPSDFYYASIKGFNYSKAGYHDFDSNNNGLYGQYCCMSSDKSVSLDGVDFIADVFLGRASAGSGSQAKAFVDKVIAYEKLEDAQGNPFDLDYLKKIIYVASILGSWRAHKRQSDTNTPPAKGLFTHKRGSTITRINLSFDIPLSVSGKPNYRLVARTLGIDEVLEYSISPSSNKPSWHFCTDNTYSVVQSNRASQFVRVNGPEVFIDPELFVWDYIPGLESATRQQEDLRLHLDKLFPDFNKVQRHYDDYFNLFPPPHIDKLNKARLNASLDQGCHFLSLNGHGGGIGCCGLSTGSGPKSYHINNRNKYFIAFANSCLTAMVDYNDSAAEKLTLDQDGGAVAYVGNTRISWGNNEQSFWKCLAHYGRIGPASGLYENFI